MNDRTRLESFKCPIYCLANCSNQLFKILRMIPQPITPFGLLLKISLIFALVQESDFCVCRLSHWKKRRNDLNQTWKRVTRGTRTN